MVSERPERCDGAADLLRREIAAVWEAHDALRCTADGIPRQSSPAQASSWRGWVPL